MMYYEFEAGNKSYKLRLNTRNLIELEKKIGGSPLTIFSEENPIPAIETMVTILHASLQQLNHGITYDETCNIFDEYLETHKLNDFVFVIYEIYRVSGLIPDVELDELLNKEKN